MNHFCLVIYNKIIPSSKAYQTLMEADGINDKHYNIVIYDNSVNKECLEYNKLFSEKNNIIYCGGKGNVGLAKAYNSVAKYLITHYKAKDFLITLDDDSEIDKAYVRRMQFVTENVDADVYAPMVFTDGVLLSPSNSTFYGKINMVKTLDEIAIKRITCINSGLWIRISVLDEIKYNEKLFLDMVDHSFFDELRKQRKKVKCVSNAIIRQNYSQFEESSLDSKLARYAITVYDTYIYAQKNILKRIYFILFQIKQAFILDKKYETTSFIRCFIEKMNKMKLKSWKDKGKMLC